MSVLREARTFLAVFLMNLAARVDVEAFMACCEAVTLALDVERRTGAAYDPHARRN